MVILFTILSISAYGAFFLHTQSGWRKLDKTHRSNRAPGVFVSVIIPFRNEAENIKSLLHSLNAQDFPETMWELILIDDHSEDGSADLAKSSSHYSSINLKLLSLDGNQFSKKAAISKGIENAKGSLIVTTDADTTRGAHWLSGIVNEYEEFKAEMIICPVLLEQENNFLSQFQSLELLAMQYITFSYSAKQNPILCSGANLAYEKAVFQNVNGYQNTPEVASGDDVFLLNKIKSFKNALIRPLFNSAVKVKTRSENSWKEFINQRIRWAGKTKHLKDNSVLLLGFYNLLISIAMILLPIVEFSVNQSLRMSGILYFIKFLGDYTILKSISKSLNEPLSVRYFSISFVIYPFYFCLIFILSLFTKPIWKGRQS